MSGLEGRSGSNLGSSLIRQQFSTKIVSEKAIVETERGKSKLRSVTQCDDLEELMSNAVLAGTDFRSQRGEMIIVGSEARQEGERVRAPEAPRCPYLDGRVARCRTAELDRTSVWRFSTGDELADMEEVKEYLLTPLRRASRSGAGCGACLSRRVSSSKLSMRATSSLPLRRSRGVRA